MQNKLRRGGGGGGGHSHLGCRDMFLKIVSSLKTIGQKGVKYTFLERYLHWLFKNTKIITIGATGKSYSGFSPKSVPKHVFSIKISFHMF